MATTTYETPVVNEATWQTWVAKNKVEEKARVRTMRVVAGVVLALLAVGGAYFLRGA